MADGWYLENRKKVGPIPYLGNGLTDRHEFWCKPKGYKMSNFLKSKMVVGRHFENGSIATSRQRFDPSARNVARWSIGPIDPPTPLKGGTVKNSRWLMAAILKIEKSSYVPNCLTDRHEVWYVEAYWHSHPLKFRNLKNPKRQTTAIFKMFESLYLDNRSTDPPAYLVRWHAWPELTEIRKGDITCQHIDYLAMCC